MADCMGFNMKQTLWTLAFALALLRTELDFFHVGRKGDGTLETQGRIYTWRNLAASQSPTHSPWDAFLTILWKSLNFTENSITYKAWCFHLYAWMFYHSLPHPNPNRFPSSWRKRPLTSFLFHVHLPLPWLSYTHTPHTHIYTHPVHTQMPVNPDIHTLEHTFTQTYWMDGNPCSWHFH